MQNQGRIFCTIFLSLTLVIGSITPFAFAAAPDEPTNVRFSGNPSATALTLQWTTPASDGGETITGYKIDRATESTPGTFGSYSTVVSNTGSSGTSYEFTGLTAGDFFKFKVYAINADGTSSASTEFFGGTTPPDNQQTDYSNLGNQTFSSGQTFGQGTSFGENQKFGGVMNFGGSQNFGDGTEFSEGQTFEGAHDFSGENSKFGHGTEFDSAQTFGTGTNFTGAQTFVGANTFGSDAKFGDGQTFSAAQTFGTGTNFTGQTTFADNQAFSDNTVFSGCGGTGDCQVFDDDHTYDFSAASMSFGNGTHFGKARTFGTGMNFTGAQTFVGANTFGADAKFGDGQEFSAAQTFGTGTNFTGQTTFANNQAFPASSVFSGCSGTGDCQVFDDDHTLDFSAAELSFGNGTHFGKARTFGTGMNFTGAQQFIGANTFGMDAKFGDGQTFSTAQTFGTGTQFTGQTTFANNQAFGASSVFSGCGGTGDCQVFDDAHTLDFSAASMSFGNGTHFGKARTFGTGMNFTGAQQFIGGNIFGADAKFGDGQTFTGKQTFGTGTEFTGPVAFANDQSFVSGMVFSGCSGTGDCQVFDDNNVSFANGTMSFGNGTHFGKARTFGPSMNFTGMQQFIGANTFGAYTDFGHGQEFSQAQTFNSHTHFGGSTDFTAASNFVFKSGMSFGDGTTFRTGQAIPSNVVMDFGIMLDSITCGTNTNSAADCKPDDDTKFLEPGEFLASGQDPAPINQKLTSLDKTLSIDGLGFEMTFDSVTNDGTVEVDAMDPATISGATLGTDGRISVTSGSANGARSVGSILDISMATANSTGTMSITLDYKEENIPSGMTEADLKMIHQVNGAWVEETNCAVDRINNKITCNITSLSPIGVGASSSSSSGQGGNKYEGPGLWWQALHENNFELLLDGYKINETDMDIEIAHPDNPRIPAKVGTPLELKLMLPDVDTYSIGYFEVCLLVPESRFSYCNEKYDPSISWTGSSVIINDLTDKYFSGIPMIAYDRDERSFTTTMNFAKPVEDAILKISLADATDMHRQYYNLDIINIETVEADTIETVEADTIQTPVPETSVPETSVPKTDILQTDIVNIEIDAPTYADVGDTVPIVVKFSDDKGGLFSSVNYDILVIHDGQTLIDETGVYEQNGVGKHTTPRLNTWASDENPLEIIVTFQGLGVEPPFSGPIGITSNMQVVPEFSIAVIMILVISITGIIVASSKLRITPRLS